MQVGLRALMAPLDCEFFESMLSPVFLAEQGGNLEPMLQLAEAVSDGVRHIREASPGGALARELAASAESLLAAVEAAEDGGEVGIEVVSGTMGDLVVSRRERFVRRALVHSRTAAAMVRGCSESGELPLCEHPRSQLQFWYAAVADPSFDGERLPEVADFTDSLRRLEADEGLLQLLSGRWSPWPGFAPDRVLTLGGVPDPRVERSPDSDWTVRSPAFVRSVAERLRLQLRRAIHLAFLRREHPRVHTDVVRAMESEPALLDDYEQLMAQHPWSEGYAGTWAFTSGLTNEPPKQLLFPGFPSDLSRETAARHAHHVSALFRETLGVLRIAAEEDLGVLVMFV